jgi:hypothetical protein
VPNSLIYYTARYRTFIQRVIPAVECSVLVARDGGRVVGFLPFCIKSDARWGSVLNSQPFFGSHGGAVVVPDAHGRETIAATLYAALFEISRTRGIAALTIVENPLEPLSDTDQRAAGTEVVDHRIGQFTPLPGKADDAEEKIFSRLHVKTRNAVRKGRKAGLEIECTTDAAILSWFQRVHEESIISLGGVAKSLDIFRSLLAVFGPSGQIRLYVGRQGGRPVCGLLILLHQDTVEYYTPVVERESRESQVLSALIVEVMIATAQEGYRTWNWGGTWPSQQGVYRFKSRWGAEERPYRYHNHLFNPEITRTNKEEMLSTFPSFYVYRFA